MLANVEVKCGEVIYVECGDHIIFKITYMIIYGMDLSF